MKITISKSDKFTMPGMYESSGTGFSMEFDVPEGVTTPELLQQFVQQCKQQFEAQYWPLAYYDFQTFLERARLGSQTFIQARINS